MNDSNINILFTSEKIESHHPEVAVPQIRNYIQYFGSRRQRYNNTNKVVASLEPEEGIELNEKYQNFNLKYNEINTAVNEALKENDIIKAIESMNEFNIIFHSMEKEYIKHEKEYQTLPADLKSLYQEMHQNYNHISNSLKLQLDNSRSEIFVKIQEGINSLLEIKDEYGITGSFKNKIFWEIVKTKASSFLYFWLFIGSLVLIPTLIGATFIVPDISKLKWYEAYILRLSIAAPLIWMAAFFHKNHSLRTVAAMKFDHLSRLLGGGAGTIAELVKSDETAKAEVYKRLSVLFLDIKDISDIASIRTKPIDKALNDAMKIISKVKT